MATADQLIRISRLVCNLVQIQMVATNYAVSNPLNLIADSGKALRHRVEIVKLDSGQRVSPVSNGHASS